MMRLVSLLLLGTVTLSGCVKEVSKNIDQSKIWTSYELFYDQNADSTYALAVFRFSSWSGTALLLSDPSGVRFNDETMDWKAEKSLYERGFAGLLPTGIFEWTDTEGNVYTNSIEIHEVAYPVLPDTLFKDESNGVGWIGDPVAADESMRLTMDGTGDSDTRIFSADSVGKTIILLDSIKLSQVTSGAVSLFLDRNYSPDLQEETERGGRLVGRYRPVDMTIILADSIS